MEIYEKRGVWYVTDPPNDVQKFDSEEEAIAYVDGHAEPDDKDSILDEDWDDE